MLQIDFCERFKIKPTVLEVIMGENNDKEDNYFTIDFMRCI